MRGSDLVCPGCVALWTWGALSSVQHLTRAGPRFARATRRLCARANGAKARAAWIRACPPPAPVHVSALVFDTSTYFRCVRQAAMAGQRVRQISTVASTLSQFICKIWTRIRLAWHVFQPRLSAKPRSTHRVTSVSASCATYSSQLHCYGHINVGVYQPSHTSAIHRHRRGKLETTWR